MGRKKNLKDIDPDVMDLIDDKMNNGVEDRYLNSNKIFDYKIVLKCKNKKQKEYHNLIKTKDVILCSGEPGTGKSYVALATALELLKGDNGYKRLIVVVPTVEAGNMNIGYLKGTKEEKIMPYLDADLYTIEKILDASGNNGKDVLSKLIKSEVVFGEPIGYMRGKTIDNSLVLITEAENFSKQELFLILSRIGDNSKYIINGDVKQLDRKDLKRDKQECGLEHAMSRLKDIPEIGIIHFTQEDIVRNPLISKIMDKWF